MVAECVGVVAMGVCNTTGQTQSTPVRTTERGSSVADATTTDAGQRPRRSSPGSCSTQSETRL